MRPSLSRRAFAGGLAALAGAAPVVSRPVLAQPAWPARPVQLVHGFGAGGNADVIARIVAQKLQAQIGQSVVVDIKSGAGGMLATTHVAKAEASGHTLVLLTGAHTASAAMRKTLPYDPVKDFAFVSTVTSFPLVIAVRAEHPARNLAELLQQAKAATDRVSFTSVGIGSTQHLTGELLGAAAGVQLLHVPYRGGGAPVTSVIAGEVDVLVDTLTVALPHIKSGRLRALGVTSPVPWASLPAVLPVGATLPGFEVLSWLGLAAPAGTPEPVVRRFNVETRAILQAADVQASLAAAGSAPAYSTPEQMRDMVQSDITRWRGVITRRGIQIEA